MQLHVLSLRELVLSTDNQWWSICILLDALHTHCVHDDPKKIVGILDCKTIQLKFYSYVYEHLKVHDDQKSPDNRSAIHWQPSPLLSYVMHCSSRFRRDSLGKSRPDHAIDRLLASAWNSRSTWDDPWRTEIHINEMKENKKQGRKVHQ